MEKHWIRIVRVLASFSDDNIPAFNIASKAYEFINYLIEKFGEETVNEYLEIRGCFPSTINTLLGSGICIEIRAEKIHIEVSIAKEYLIYKAKNRSAKVDGFEGITETNNPILYHKLNKLIRESRTNL